MNHSDVLFAGFLVVIAILIIYFLFIYKNDNKRRDAYKTKQQKSSGSADRNALEALQEINTIQRPNAEDNYNAGRIEELNVLEGNIDNAREQPGIIPDIIGRFNNAIAAVRENREEHLRAQRHQRNLRARLRTEAARNGADAPFGLNGDLLVADMLFGGGLHRPRTDPPPEVMVAHIGDFAFGGLNLILGEVNAGDDFWAPIVPPLQIMAFGAQQTGSQLREDRVNIAAEGAETKEEFVKNYLESTITHTSDPQNVHNSSTNTDLNNTLNKLRISSSEVPVSEIFMQIDKYLDDSVKNGSISAKKSQDAKMVLKTAKIGSYISQFNDKEDMILKYVWDRSDLPENSHNSTNIKNSICEALADCSNGENSTVCAGGRASRYLGSLVMLDVDPNVGAAMRSEDYKNQILREISNLIDFEAEKAAESDDDDIRSVGRSYSDPSVVANPAAEAKFNEMLRQKIDAHIDSYSEHLKPHQLEEFKNDAKAALG